MRALILTICFLAAPALAQVRAERQMVAAAHPLAAEAGLAMLRAGGSAVDAAIAAQMVLALVEPQSSGLGGGAFLLHYDAATRAVTSWDGRETAPAAARPDLFLAADGTPLRFDDVVPGGRAVGTPGLVRMLEAAHRAHGRLPWAQLFEPAIRLATDGFRVPARLARAVAVDAKRLRRDAAARAYFFLADGRPIPEGLKLANPALAATLRTLAAEGADAFYRGPLAADIAASVRSDPNPGLLTTDDLAAYQPRQRDPVCGPYRAVLVCSMGPPSSGGVAVLQILGLLGHFDMAGLDPESAYTAHLLVEAGRLAFADRNRYLGDADFVPVPLAGLLDPVYLTVRAQLIDPVRALATARAGNPRWDAPPYAPHADGVENGTSHLVAVDADGNAVSMTTTIEAPFGARLMVHGFMLNNELSDFSFRPEINGRPVANAVRGGKRPRSSMAPVIVLDAARRLVLAAGSPGGARIIGYVAQALVAMIDRGADPRAAAAQPHIGTTGEAAELEAGTAAAALRGALEVRGHQVVVRPMTSGLQAIAVLPDGSLVGGADPRGEGVAIGD